MAPVFYRILQIPAADRQITDLSLGGIRIYSDERLDKGQRLDLRIYLPGGTSIEATAEVVWIKELPQGSGANHDVGMKFIDLSAEGLKEIRYILKKG